MVQPLCGAPCKKCGRPDWTCTLDAVGCPLPLPHHFCPTCLARHDPLPNVCDACFKTLKCEEKPVGRTSTDLWRCDACLILNTEARRHVIDRQYLPKDPPKLFYVVRFTFDGKTMAKRSTAGYRRSASTKTGKATRSARLAMGSATPSGERAVAKPRVGRWSKTRRRRSRRTSVRAASS